MFIALRHLNTADGRVAPGDPIPSAETWKPGVQVSEVNGGNVFDLDRRVVLSPAYSPGAHKRERELLRRIEAQQGKRVVTRADGKCEVVPIYGWVDSPIGNAPEALDQFTPRLDQYPATVDQAVASCPDPAVVRANEPRKRGGRSRG